VARPTADIRELIAKHVDICNKHGSALPILDLLFRLKGKPYSLRDHFVFFPLYDLQQPRSTVLMCGRQVGKTTNLAIQSVLLAATRPFSTILFVSPLGEQISRFSTIYLSEILRQSVIGKMLKGPGTVDRVLQKDFSNNSHIILSYATDDPDRVRNISASRLVVDETQDMLLDAISVIKETLSHSEQGGQILYAGTPKTGDNTLTQLWLESSQAEWFVPCTHCTTDGHPTWNIPSPKWHLEEMIGPYHNKISEEYPATLCYKCKQPISPRLGRWVHLYPDRTDYAGYHVPQLLLPHHYANPANWKELLKKRLNLPPYLFYNEVLGWPYDLAAAIITLEDLQRTAVMPPRTDPSVVDRAKKYTLLVMGIDWGGGGEEEKSFTTLALAGLSNDGKIDVIWGRRLLTPHDHIKEAIDIATHCVEFSPHYIAHDYAGGGAIRETILVQAGMAESRLIPYMYATASMSGLCVRSEPSPLRPRPFYLLNKARSLQILCTAIRLGHIRFFADDYVSAIEPGLLRDFLSLKEETASSSTREAYRITKKKGSIDDFAQAVNYACCTIWQMTSWPDIAKMLVTNSKDKNE